MAKQSSTPKIHTKKHIARLEREKRQVRLITTLSIIAIALALILVGYGALDSVYLKLRQPVAEVNGEKITLGYWRERVQLDRLNLLNTLQQYQYFQQSFGMDTSQQQQQIMSQLQSAEFMGEQTLNTLIDEALIRQEAEKRGIVVTTDEVDARIQQRGFNFFPDGTQTPTVTPTEFSYPTLTNEQLTMYPPTSPPTEVLTSTPAPTATRDPAAATATPTSTPAPATPTFLPQLPTSTAVTPTPYTLDGFKKQYDEALKNIKNNFNVNEKTFRSVYENEIYSEKLLEEIAKDTPRVEEQVLARHILVSDAGLVKSIEALLLHGGDFAELAAKYSEDTGSAAKGGELDWSSRDTFVPEFAEAAAEAAFSQPIGEIGKAVQSQYGYHIIQVVARQELPVSPEQYEQKRQAALTDWVAKTREEATTAGSIVTFDIWKDNVPELPASLQQ